MTDQEKSLRELLSQATPGPWEWFHGSILNTHDDNNFEMEWVSNSTKTREQDEKDGKFILAARNALPDLLAELDRLREENAALRGACCNHGVAIVAGMPTRIDGFGPPGD